MAQERARACILSFSMKSHVTRATTAWRRYRVAAEVNATQMVSFDRVFASTAAPTLVITMDMAPLAIER